MTRTIPPKKKMRRTKFNGIQYPPYYLKDVANPGSMPTKWNKSMIARAFFLATEGFTDHKIAIALGVHKETIYYWKRTKPEFEEALKKGKDKWDDQVEQAMLESAVGYTHTDIHVSTTKDGKVIETPITKYYPPNVTAGIFWLKNRRRDKWADVHRLDQNVNINLAHIQHIDLNAEFTIAELEVLESVGLKQIAQHARNDNPAD